MISNNKKIIKEKIRCVECDGELESCDNENSHTNLRICITNLKNTVNALLYERDHPDGY